MPDVYGIPTLPAQTSVILNRALTLPGVSATTVANTTQETIVYAFTVPGNTMGPQSRLRCTLLARVSDTTNDATNTQQSYTAKLKLGPTTPPVITSGIVRTAATDATNGRIGFGANRTFKLMWEIQNLNSLNVQQSHAVWDSFQSNGATVTFALNGANVQPWALATSGNLTVGGNGAGAIGFHDAQNAQSAITTSQPMALSITWQWAVALATSIFTLDGVVLELL